MADPWYIVGLNDLLESVVVGSLAEIPYAGGFISTFVSLLWPQDNQQEPIWPQIAQQVQAAINQSIEQSTLTQMTAVLVGLESVMGDYSEGPNYDNWVSARDTIDADVPQFMPGFQSDGTGTPTFPDACLLLPVFAQVINLKLALLREGVLFGASVWSQDTQSGASSENWDDVYSDLQTSISQYSQWVTDTINVGLTNIPEPSVQHPMNSMWQMRNNLVRSLTLTAGDYAYYWPYFDPKVYPPPCTPPPNQRVIYSDPNGDLDDSDGENYTDPDTYVQGPNNTIVQNLNPQSFLQQPDGRITQIIVWGDDRVGSIQVYYDNQPGPVMGNPADTTSPWHGRTGGAFFVEPLNPIIQVVATCSDVLNGIQFFFKDGSSTPVFGYGYPQGSPVSTSCPPNILSSISINQSSNFYNCAQSAIFSLKYESSYPQLFFGTVTSDVDSLYVCFSDNLSNQLVVASSTDGITFTSYPSGGTSLSPVIVSGVPLQIGYGIPGIVISGGTVYVLFKSNNTANSLCLLSYQGGSWQFTQDGTTWQSGQVCLNNPDNTMGVAGDAALALDTPFPGYSNCYVFNPLLGYPLPPPQPPPPALGTWWVTAIGQPTLDIFGNPEITTIDPVGWAGPAMIVFQGYLYVAYGADDQLSVAASNSPIPNSSGQPAQLTATVFSDINLSGRPAMAAVGNTLFVAFRSPDPSNQLNIATISLDITPGFTVPVVSTPVVVSGISLSGSPSITGLNGSLYVLYTDLNGKLQLSSTSDLVGFSGWSTIAVSDQLTSSS